MRGIVQNGRMRSFPLVSYRQFVEKSKSDLTHPKNFEIPAEPEISTSGYSENKTSGKKSLTFLNQFTGKFKSGSISEKLPFKSRLFNDDFMSLSLSCRGCKFGAVRVDRQDRS